MPRSGYLMVISWSSYFLGLFTPVIVAVVGVVIILVAATLTDIVKDYRRSRQYIKYKEGMRAEGVPFIWENSFTRWWSLWTAIKISFQSWWEVIRF